MQEKVHNSWHFCRTQETKNSDQFIGILLSLNNLLHSGQKSEKKLFKITSKAKINVFLFSFPLYSALTGSFSTTPIESFFFKSNFILAFEDNNYKASHCTLLSNFSWLWISKFGIQKRNFYWEYFLRPLFAAIICPYQLYRI